jgi:hypothetical protein
VDTPGHGDRYGGRHADLLRRRAEREQTPITRGIFPSPGPLYLGRWPQPGRLLKGMLDDTAIYSRALVPEEIRLLTQAPATDPM